MSNSQSSEDSPVDEAQVEDPTSMNDANPSDQNVERSIAAERRYLNRRENSIIPEPLEGTEVGSSGEEDTDMENKESRDNYFTEDISELSSDKEKDTTEGEVTDTHTSE